jgi:hypothetical protein
MAKYSWWTTTGESTTAGKLVSEGAVVGAGGSTVQNEINSVGTSNPANGINSVIAWSSFTNVTGRLSLIQRFLWWNF